MQANVSGLFLATLLLLGFGASPRSAFGAGPQWVGSWMAAPCAPASVEPRSEQFQLQEETVRQIVHLSIGGLGVRLRFSNVFGTAPLALQSVHVAQRSTGNAIDPATDKVVTFSGSDEVTIAPGKSVLSDPVNLPVAASSDISVSFFIPGKVTAPAIHYTALQTSYLAHGDQSAAESFGKDAKTTTLDLILTAVDVATRTAPGAIVAIGSSTTDGAHSTPNSNHRWTDYLFARLSSERGADAPSVLNAGISGNHVLTDGRGDWGPVWGQSAVSRFGRDVLAQDGVKAVILFEGGNDIRQFGSDAASAQQLIAGFELMIRMAHERGVKVIVGTITSFEHSNPHEPEDGVWERVQAAFNQWARTAKDIDGVVDFDAAIRDPKHPARILPMYDSGDHLHPNDAGYQAMADSCDLALFLPNP
jgi:lysophospholipase L1-like esterase